jgi:hypothetical protein
MADPISNCHKVPVRRVYGDGRMTFTHLECSSCGAWVNLPNQDAPKGCIFTLSGVLVALVILVVASAVMIGWFWAVFLR